MSPKQEHHITLHSSGCPVSALGPHPIPIGLLEVDLCPRIRHEVEPVEVVAIVTVIAAKHVHAVLIYYG